MVIISLLDLPVDLPPDAEARQYGLDKFTSGLPKYLSRCPLLSFKLRIMELELLTSCRPVIRRRNLRKSWHRSARSLCLLCSGVSLHPGPTGRDRPQVRWQWTRITCQDTPLRHLGIWTFLYCCLGSPLANTPPKEDSRGEPTNWWTAATATGLGVVGHWSNPPWMACSQPRRPRRHRAISTTGKA